MMNEDSLIGKTIGHCRLLSKLGAGGMGSVYLAEHAALGRKVAIKILPNEMSHDEEYVTRFRREAVTTGRLEHPNIVQIHDVGEAEGFHYIVMQYIEGEPLSTLVAEAGPIEPRYAARLAAGILRGLHQAHEQGIVHRDVKPDNVLLAGGDQPKLLDFGLAVETDNTLQLTRDGMVVGTPYYLSPEQARGRKATPGSDVYAAGVTLYFILTGRRPFNGPTALVVLNKHIREMPVPPIVHKPDIPPVLNDIVLKMMAKRPEDRYPTAAAAADDIDEFLADRPVHVDLPRRLPWLTTQFKVAAAVAGALLVTALALILIPRPEKPTAAPNPAAAPMEPESPELAAILAYQAEHQGDNAAAGEILDRYNAFLKVTVNLDFAERARGRRNAFLTQLDERARDEYRKIPEEPALRLRALEAFPKPLLDLTEVGAFVRAERDKLARAAAVRPPPPKPEDPLRLLEAEYRDVHAKSTEALARRENAAAYGHVTAFLRARKVHTRVEGLDYEKIVSLVPDSVLPEPLLAEARGAINSAWKSAPDTLPYRILADLQDALDLEWLVRRAAEGLGRLSRENREITLTALQATGRVTFGPSGYALTPRAGAEKPIAIRTLLPRDLLTLTDAKPEDPAAARAAGVAHLHSSAPDARSGAAHWLLRAADLGAPSPAWRLEPLRAEARPEMRKRMSLALRGTPEAAVRALAELGPLCAGDPELKEEHARATARALVAALKAAGAAMQYSRVKELARQVRAGPHDAAEIDPLCREALLKTGEWRRASLDLKGDFWTWEGKAKGAASPARDDRSDGLSLAFKRRIALSPERLRGTSGLSAQVRVNVEARGSRAGILFDRRMLTIDAAGQAALWEVATPEATPKLVASTETGQGAGRWVDLAFAAEGEDLVCSVEKKPVFGIRAVSRPEAAIFLWSELDANFREVHLRK